MCDSDMDCSDDEMDYYYDGKYTDEPNFLGVFFICREN